MGNCEKRPPAAIRSTGFRVRLTVDGMIARQMRIWRAVMPMMIAVSMGAQFDWTDKSPHKSNFLTVNNVKLHYLDTFVSASHLIFVTCELYNGIRALHSFTCKESSRPRS
jgi:hypothetical protein